MTRSVMASRKVESLTPSGSTRKKPGHNATPKTQNRKCLEPLRFHCEPGDVFGGLLYSAVAWWFCCFKH
jgi:hypothetical protein